MSIDYGILEKAKNVAVIPARDIGWSDVGGWESLSEVSVKDHNGNTIQGNVLDIASRGVFVLGNRRLVTTIGLKDLIIVDTDDALLVCRKDASQKVKEVVEKLKNKGKKYI